MNFEKPQDVNKNEFSSELLTNPEDLDIGASGQETSSVVEKIPDNQGGEQNEDVEKLAKVRESLGMADNSQTEKNETPEERQRRLTEEAEKFLENLERQNLDRGRFSYYQFTGDEEHLKAEGGKGGYSVERLLKNSPPRRIILFGAGEAVEAYKEPEKPEQNLKMIPTRHHKNL